jgi:hypothetical protein
MVSIRKVDLINEPEKREKGKLVIGEGMMQKLREITKTRLKEKTQVRTMKHRRNRKK